MVVQLILPLVANNALPNMLVGNLMELPFALQCEFDRIPGKDINTHLYFVELPSCGADGWR